MTKEKIEHSKKAPFKLNFRGVHGAQNNFPKNTKRKYLVMLSLRNDHCSGEYLEQIVLRSTKNQEFTTFLIGDGNHWHNLKSKIDHTPEEIAALKREALAIGDDYFKANQDYFLSAFGFSTAQLATFKSELEDKNPDEIINIINQKAINEGKNFEICRWNTWMYSKAHPYAEHEESINQLYLTEPLKQSVKKTATEFVNRHAHEGDTKILKKNSKDYVRGEGPLIWVAAYLKYNFLIYPGPMIDCFKESIDYFIFDEKTPTDHKHALHFKNPKLYVNWLRACFTPKKLVKSIESNEPLEQNTLQLPTANNCINNIVPSESNKKRYSSFEGNINTFFSNPMADTTKDGEEEQHSAQFKYILYSMTYSLKVLDIKEQEILIKKLNHFFQESKKNYNVSDSENENYNDFDAPYGGQKAWTL